MSESNEAVVTPATPKVKRNSPSPEQFVDIVNVSDNRQDALTRFKNAGFDVTYSAFAARYNSYRKQNVTMKALPNLPKGRKLDVAALNARTATPVA